MVKHCAYGVCTSDSDKEPNLRWAPFPKPNVNQTAARAWIQLVGRANFSLANITKHTYVCEKHFDVGAVLDIRKNPHLRPAPYKTPLFQQYPNILSRKRPVRKNDASSVTATSSSNKENEGSGTRQSPDNSQKQQDRNRNSTKNSDGTLTSVDNNEGFEIGQEVYSTPSPKVRKISTDSAYDRPTRARRNITLTLPIMEKTPDKINQRTGSTPSKTPSVSVGCQVQVPTKGLVKRLEGRVSYLEKKLKTKRSISSFILETVKTGKYYTGLNKPQREALWKLLGAAKYRLRIINTKKLISSKSKKLTVEDQFLLTLFKLRCNYTFVDLGLRFDVSPELLSKIFKSWLQLMYLKFKAIEPKMFTLYCDLPKPPPKAFNNSLLKYTRVVIDCSELFIENTTDFRNQGNIFSSYKHHPTAKVLIGVAPSGGAVFISDCYEGSISDREIVIQSGFLDHMNANDLVLADRGFNIEDLLAEKGARLNIPPFLHGRPNFTLAETRKTKLIARARIHIERFNQRFKRYRFLKGIIPQRHVDVLTQAVYVCACLSNFDQPLAC